MKKFILFILIASACLFNLKSTAVPQSYGKMASSTFIYNLNTCTPYKESKNFKVSKYNTMNYGPVQDASTKITLEVLGKDSEERCKMRMTLYLLSKPHHDAISDISNIFYIRKEEMPTVIQYLKEHEVHYNQEDKNNKPISSINTGKFESYIFANGKWQTFMSSP